MYTKISFKLFLCLVFASSIVKVSGSIHEKGYWFGDEAINEHVTDYALADALVNFFKAEKAKSVVDLGCGIGAYVNVLRYNNIDTNGYDGNPNTIELSNGVAEITDLTEPLNFKKEHDWVLCLEVGEHIPKRYETVLLDNLDRNNTKGIVLSWAIKGQGGYGHVNEQNNETIKSLMKSRGYSNDIQAENQLRKLSTLWWFKNSIMVFRKQQEINLSSKTETK